MRARRPTQFCRSWLFLNGAEEYTLEAAPRSGADVLIQELEDFTPPERRPEAHQLAAVIYPQWRRGDAVVGVRVNPLSLGGLEDLAAVMKGAPDVVALPKVSEPEHVVELDRAVTSLEQQFGLAPGVTELLPNIELARGVMQTYAIASASPRVKACLLASEDLAADLGAERGRDGIELMHCRQRFLMECVAANVMAIDFPHTWIDVGSLAEETRVASRLGFKAKSAVHFDHARVINDLLTPSKSDIALAEQIVAAFEAAQGRGDARVEVGGSIVEVPIYANAKRLLARVQALANV
ncbi:MAG: HpcH/HpaI aldolase/citrate lyase family protein [Hyphomicrobiaceae bacterium]